MTYNEPVTINYQQSDQPALKVIGDVSVADPFSLTAAKITASSTLTAGTVTAATLTTTGLNATSVKSTSMSTPTLSAGNVNATTVGTSRLTADTVSAKTLTTPAFGVFRSEGELINRQCINWTTLADLWLYPSVPVTALMFASATVRINSDWQTHLALRVANAIHNPWRGAGVAGGYWGISGGTYVPISSVYAMKLNPGPVHIEAVVRQRQSNGNVDVQCGQLIVVTVPQ
jgi:hypothetical protein